MLFIKMYMIYVLFTVQLKFSVSYYNWRAYILYIQFYKLHVWPSFALFPIKHISVLFYIHVKHASHNQFYSFLSKYSSVSYYSQIFIHHQIFMDILTQFLNFHLLFILRIIMSRIVNYYCSFNYIHIFFIFGSSYFYSF